MPRLFRLPGRIGAPGAGGEGRGEGDPRSFSDSVAGLRGHRRTPLTIAPRAFVRKVAHRCGSRSATPNNRFNRADPMRTPTHAVSLGFLLLLYAFLPGPASSQERSAGPDAPEEGPSWPVEVVLEGTRVVMCQPQPESFEGNLLAGRFALSAELADGGGEPLFGTAWFEARVDTDRDERAAYNAGYRSGFRAGSRAGQANLYNSPRVADRRATPAQLDRARPAAPANRPQARPSTRPNNVLSDRDGNVHRRTDRGWEQRTPGGSWGASPPVRPSQPQARPTLPQARPSQPVRPTQPPARPGIPQARPSQPQIQPSPQTRQQELNRSQLQRDRGAARTQEFRQSRPPTRPPAGLTPMRRVGEDHPFRGGPWFLLKAIPPRWTRGRR
jgi:hypothetical protein